MKNMLIIIILFCGKCYAQPSWNIVLWFDLSDSKGNKISTTEFSSLKAYVPNGIQVNSVIEYDTIAEMYKLSAEPATPTSNIVFIYKNDTTIIMFNSNEPSICIDSIALDGNMYNFYFDRRNTQKFRCKELLNGYDNRHVCKTVAPLSAFKDEEFLDSINMDFENSLGGWIEVKLKQ